GAVDQEMFKDSNDLKHYFYFNYPTLQIVFNQSDEEFLDPLYNYMIFPRKEIMDAIEDKYNRRFWMYGLEGIVMMGLLFWGIIWIYRSIQARNNIKKQHRNFLLSITHELKTPLTSINLYIETILNRQNLDLHQSETILKNSLYS